MNLLDIDKLAAQPAFSDSDGAPTTAAAVAKIKKLRRVENLNGLSQTSVSNST